MKKNLKNIDTANSENKIELENTERSLREKAIEERANATWSDDEINILKIHARSGKYYDLSEMYTCLYEKDILARSIAAIKRFFPKLKAPFLSSKYLALPASLDNTSSNPYAQYDAQLLALYENYIEDNPDTPLSLKKFNELLPKMTREDKTNLYARLAWVLYQKGIILNKIDSGLDNSKQSDKYWSLEDYHEVLLVIAKRNKKSTKSELEEYLAEMGYSRVIVTRYTKILTKNEFDRTIFQYSTDDLEKKKETLLSYSTNNPDKCISESFRFFHKDDKALLDISKNSSNLDDTVRRFFTKAKVTFKKFDQNNLFFRAAFLVFLNTPSGTINKPFEQKHTPCMNDLCYFLELLNQSFHSTYREFVKAYKNEITISERTLTLIKAKFKNALTEEEFDLLFYFQKTNQEPKKEQQINHDLIELAEQEDENLFVKCDDILLTVYDKYFSENPEEPLSHQTLYSLLKQTDSNEEIKNFINDGNDIAMLMRLGFVLFQNKRHTPVSSRINKAVSDWSLGEYYFILTKLSDTRYLSFNKFAQNIAFILPFRTKNSIIMLTSKFRTTMTTKEYNKLFDLKARNNGEDYRNDNISIDEILEHNQILDKEWNLNNTEEVEDFTNQQEKKGITFLEVTEDYLEKNLVIRRNDLLSNDKSEQYSVFLKGRVKKNQIICSYTGNRKNKSNSNSTYIYSIDNELEEDASTIRNIGPYINDAGNGKPNSKTCFNPENSKLEIIALFDFEDAELVTEYTPEQKQQYFIDSNTLPISSNPSDNGSSLIKKIKDNRKDYIIHSIKELPKIWEASHLALTPLHVAIIKGDKEQMQFILDNAEAPQHLLRLPTASISFFTIIRPEKDRHQLTPLMLSFWLNTKELITELIEWVDDDTLNWMTPGGTTALHCLMRNSNLTCLEQLYVLYLCCTKCAHIDILDERNTSSFELLAKKFYESSKEERNTILDQFKQIPYKKMHTKKRDQLIKQLLEFNQENSIENTQYSLKSLNKFFESSTKEKLNDLIINDPYKNTLSSLSVFSESKKREFEKMNKTTSFNSGTLDDDKEHKKQKM
jgi:hypothetical protein